MLAGASDSEKPWLGQFAIWERKMFHHQTFHAEIARTLVYIVFLLGVLVVWKLSPSESCLSISCRCSLPHISMLASWLGAFAPISMQMSGLPEARLNMKIFLFAVKIDRLQNLSQEEPFEDPAMTLAYKIQCLSWGHQLGSCRLDPQASRRLETWNITKSGRMFGVWCRLFRINSKGIYTTHIRTHVYTYYTYSPPSRSTFLLWIPGVKNKQTYTKTKGKKHALREMSHLEFPQSLLCFFLHFYVFVLPAFDCGFRSCQKNQTHVFFRRCSALLFSIIFWTKQCYNVFRMSFP